MRALKGLQCASLIFGCAIVSALVGSVSPHEPTRLRRSALIVSWLARRLLRVLNVTVRESRAFPPRPNLLEASHSGALIVANHVSFLDILVIAATRPAVFVTSVEKEEMALVGYLARLGGCLFVERRHRNRVRADRQQVSKVLTTGQDVVLFPEGTSGDGHELLPFKKGLFPAAIEVGAHIEPLAITYPRANGRDLDETTRPKLFFYGDFGVWDHLRYLLAFESIECELKWLPRTKIITQNTRELLAEEVEKIRTSIHQAIAPDETRGSVPLPF